MPNLVRDLLRFAGISLDIPKNLYVHKRINAKKRRHKKKCRDNFNRNPIVLQLNKNDCNASAQVTADNGNPTSLWGQVKDYEGNFVEDALIKLLIPVYQNDKIDYVGVAQTITDSLGFYKFHLNPDGENTRFVIIASKAINGNERIIDENSSLCDLLKV